MIEFNPQSRLSPEKGRILISEPFLSDPYFKRTVILLCEHNDEGSFGFVLNRYLDMGISRIMKEFPDIETKVGVGGPVQNQNLFFLHTLGDVLEGSTEVVNGVFMGGNFDILKLMIESGKIDESNVRFFVGYSGWSADQLDQELKEKSWIVAPSNKHSIMSTSNDSLWGDSLKSLGKKYAHLANFPENPRYN
ncbi:MAG: YqgE/AlgH family protein [Bacteroidota bacterium]